MTKFIKSLACCCLLVLGALAPPAVAQDGEPFAVVSLRSVDAVLQLIGELGEVAGIEGAAETLQVP
ncbi:MAG: hypothetical protein DWQ31_15495, partial [Planctomycetota bacterium]